MVNNTCDEQEEEQNDFLLAIMDVGTINIWTATIVLLGLFALLQTILQWSFLMSAVLLVSGFGMLVSPLGVLSWFFPVPAVYGAIRFGAWMYEGLEMVIDI